MSSFWNFVFAALLVIIWVIAGGFATQANVFLDDYKNKDAELNRAYTYTFWAAFVTWFLIALFLLLIVLSIFGIVALFGSGVGEAAEGAEFADQPYLTEEQKQTGISWFTIGFLALALVLVAITGVLSALAATAMTESSNFVTTDARLKQAYDDCIIAASMSLGAAGLLILGGIIYFVVGYEKERAYQEERQKELAELAELRRQSLLSELQQPSQTSQTSQTSQSPVLNIAAQTSDVKSQVPRTRSSQKSKRRSRK